MTTARAARRAVVVHIAAVVLIVVGACSASPAAAPRPLAGKVRMLDYAYDPNNLTVPRTR
jgi:hypothetical protein